MLARASVITLLVLLGPQTAFGGSDRQYINGPRSAARAPLPFSDGVRVGDTLYVSGHIGLDPKTDQAATDPRIEAKLVMDSVKKTVEGAGMTMDDVVTVQILCTKLALYDTFNDVYRTYFKDGFPARAFMGASSLLRGAHYEVQAIAVRHSDRR